MQFINRARLLQFIVIWSIVGFPFLALVTTALGQPSTVYSVLLRAMATVAAAVLVLVGAIRQRNRIAALLFLTFWTFYLGRLSLTTLFDPESLARPIDFYWTWSLGACFLPALAALVAFDPTAVERLRFPLLVLTVVALALGLIVGGTDFQRTDETVVDINRLNVVSLNPISLGHLGVTGVLLGICSFLSGHLRARAWGLAIAAICLGSIIVVLANSRGPLLAAVGCICLLIVAGARRKRSYIFGTLLLVIAAAVAVFEQDMIYGETGLLWRFEAFFTGVDPSASGRVIAFQGAFEQFVASPVFGDAVEERITGFYPHNLVLEALMATGVAGGLPFLVLTLWAVVRAGKLVRYGSPLTWVGVLAVQYIIGGVFSGAIYTSNTMWVLVGLTLSTPLLNYRTQQLRFRASPSPPPFRQL